MNKNAALMLDLKEEMTQSCQKYGIVKKVVVYAVGIEEICGNFDFCKKNLF